MSPLKILRGKGKGGGGGIVHRFDTQLCLFSWWFIPNNLGFLGLDPQFWVELIPQ